MRHSSFPWHFLRNLKFARCEIDVPPKITIIVQENRYVVFLGKENWIDRIDYIFICFGFRPFVWFECFFFFVIYVKYKSVSPVSHPRALICTALLFPVTSQIPPSFARVPREYPNSESRGSTRGLHSWTPFHSRFAVGNNFKIYSLKVTLNTFTCLKKGR